MEKVNNYVIELGENFSKRFVPLVSVNPRYGEDAVIELKRALSRGGK